jgi:hypothetical protein
MNWGDIYAHLITSTGWTFEYIDENMTLFRLAELSAYWKNHPPSHVCNAIMAGIKHSDSAANQDEKVPDFALLPDIEEGA